MMIDMKGARKSNTVERWHDTIWRVFLENQLFISNGGQTCFSTREDALNAVLESFWFKEVNKYIDYSQKFFDKEGDIDWRNEFARKIFDHMDVQFKEYIWNGKESNNTIE